MDSLQLFYPKFRRFHLFSDDAMYSLDEATHGYAFVINVIEEVAVTMSSLVCKFLFVTAA